MAIFAVSGITRAADEKADKAPADKQDLVEMKIGADAQVSGKIVSIHTTTLVGMNDPHILVKLESAPGDVDVVDLGSAAELKTQGIEPRMGQFFSIDGRVGSINGKPLVVAEMLSESKMIFVTQQGSLNEETTQKPVAGTDAGLPAKDAPRTPRDPNDPKVIADRAAPKTLTVDADQQVRVVEGVVINTRRVKIENDSNEHMLAKIQTDNGIVVLDLGVCSMIPATLDLSEGKTIAASGFVGHINTRPIIVADSVGNLAVIKRHQAVEVVPTGTTPATPAK